MKKTLFISYWLLSSFVALAQSILSPSQFFGYELGSKYTFHSDIERYCDYLVSKKSGQFQKYSYGRSEEGRNLFILISTSSKNLMNLNEIRLNHLRNLGLHEGASEKEETLIAWYSFNVHGDEAASSEAAMKYLYFLASNEPNENEVLIIDPCLNPDGRERYVQWFAGVRNERLHYNRKAAELKQTWPEGRYNHYLNDLNRDWAWQKQLESQQRLRLYHSWMPHVHADFHEMEASKSYFFPPPAQPLHEAIEPWQLVALENIGGDLEKLFKIKKWEFFTQKEFDLLYPSYGDTYAIFNGGVGLTLEQGGGGEAGLLFIKENGDSLHLKDRVSRHYEVAKALNINVYKNRDVLIKNMNEFHLTTIKEGNGKFKEFVIKGDNQAKIKDLTEHLDFLQIAYSFAQESQNIAGYDFKKRASGNLVIASGDLIISTFQAKGHLVRVLFEPTAEMRAAKTYDISAWSLPYLKHIQCFGIPQKLEINRGLREAKKQVELSEEISGCAILWNSPSSVKFLSEAMNRKARVFLDTLDGRTALVLLKEDENFNIGEAVAYASRLGLEYKLLHKKEVRPFKKANLEPIKSPRILTLVGSGIKETAHGDLIFYLEKVLSYPYTKVWEKDFESVNLDDFDLIIFPDGQYENLKYNDDKLKRWIADGGRLVLMEGGLSFAERLNIGVLKKKNWDELTYAKDKDEAVNLLQGAIFNAQIAEESPLRHGLPDGLNFIFEKRPDYTTTESKTDFAGKIESSDLLSGFVGQKVNSNLDNTFVFGTYYFGSGVIYQLAFNPLFRGLLEDGNVLMGNVIFMPIRLN